MGLLQSSHSKNTLYIALPVALLSVVILGLGWLVVYFTFKANFLSVLIVAFFWRRRTKSRKEVKNFVVGVENRGMGSLDERNNTVEGEERRAEVDMRALNMMHPEPLPPLPFLTATSILGGQMLENNQTQVENKRAAGMTKRVEGLDIDNPLYNYTENCNRSDMHQR